MNVVLYGAAPFDGVWPSPIDPSPFGPVTPRIMPDATEPVGLAAELYEIRAALARLTVAVEAIATELKRKPRQARVKRRAKP